MYWWSWSFFGMNFLWWIFWVLLFVSFFALMTPVPRSRTGRTRASALDLLQRRYAAGEISTAEYEERRAILMRDREGSERPAAAPPAERTTGERTVPPGPTVPQPH